MCSRFVGGVYDLIQASNLLPIPFQIFLLRIPNKEIIDCHNFFPIIESNLFIQTHCYCKLAIGQKGTCKVETIMLDIRLINNRNSKLTENSL